MSKHTHTSSAGPAGTVPLYHHQQVPLPSTFFPTKAGVFLQPSSLSQWHHSSMNHTTSPTYDLKDLITHYQSQPDILRLILQSKLEEDKRRAEEAKLKAKELDLILVQRQSQLHAIHRDSLLSSVSPLDIRNTSEINSIHNGQWPGVTPATDNPLSALPTLLQSSTPINQHAYPTQPNVDALLHSPQLLQNALSHHSSPQQPSLSSSATISDELDDRLFSPVPGSVGGLSPAIFDVNIDRYPSAMSLKSSDPSFSPRAQGNVFSANPHQVRIQPTPTTSTSYHSHRDSYLNNRPRRRREMQAITQIVETRDNPYVDGYFWKNNGNTIQKKTGNKSVYYKCANSNKGCSVNKTVTAKGDGEYIIKYRGEHIPECNKIRRVVEL